MSQFGVSFEVQDLTLSYIPAPHCAVSAGAAHKRDFQSSPALEVPNLTAGLRLCELERMGVQVEESSCSGRNWGLVDIESSTLTFQVDKKPAFRLPLRDVGQVQQVQAVHLIQACLF